tara:strand:+ start:1363 stop:3594 length:2232 start_codon:yes stop_codon:yes gene_type:complete
MPPPEQQLLLRAVQERRERLGLPLDMRVTQAELNAVAQELQGLRPQRGRDPRETRLRREASGLPTDRSATLAELKAAGPGMIQAQRRPETDAVEVARARRELEQAAPLEALQAPARFTADLALYGAERANPWWKGPIERAAEAEAERNPFERLSFRDHLRLARTAPGYAPGVRGATEAILDPLNLVGMPFIEKPMRAGLGLAARGARALPGFLRRGGRALPKARGGLAPSVGGGAPSYPSRRPEKSAGYEAWEAGGGLDVEEARKMTALPEGEKVYSGPYPEQRDRSTGTLAHQVPSAKASSYVKDLLRSAKAREELLAYIDEGLEMGGREWYNTEPIRNLFVGRFGDDEGHRLFVQFINLIGAASPGSDVQGNIRVGSLLRKTLEPFEGSMGRSRGEAIAAGEGFREGVVPPGKGAEYEAWVASGKVDEEEFNKMLNFIDLVSKGKGIDAPAGYGRVYGVEGLFKTIKSWVEGKWDDPNYVNNPKVRSFAAALLGSKEAVAIDVHAMRIMGMVSDSPAAWLGGKQAIGKEAFDGLKAKYKGKRVSRLIGEDGKLATRKRRKDGTLILKAGDHRKSLSIHHFLDKTSKSWKGKTGPQEGIELTFNASEAVKSGLVDIEDIKHMPSVYRKAPAKNDYGELARLMTELATARGITPAQAQASIWMAAAGRTGVSGLSRGTFVDLVINRIFAQAEDRGLPPMAIIHDLIKHRGLISFLAGLAGAQGMLSIQGEEEKEEPAATGTAQ